MAASPERSNAPKVAGAALVVAIVALLGVFPPFRIVPLNPQGLPAGGPVGGSTFDPVAAAAQVWHKDLPAAVKLAPDLGTVAPAIRANPAAARARFAHATGLGTAYYFVRGHGRVVARDTRNVRIAVDGDRAAVVALRIGPVFGNTVRDGCGLLDVNAYPGLAEFNALAAELNTRVEQDVLPGLRAKAVVGAEVDFAGCAEVPESDPAAGDPLLEIIPVQAEVKP